MAHVLAAAGQVVEGVDLLDGGIGVNHLVTDGLDRLVLNTHDTVQLGVAYPGARSATIDWGDGSVEPGTVNSALGEVSGSHRYELPVAGPFAITVTTLGANGVVTARALPATAFAGLRSAAPGAVTLEAVTATRGRVIFPGVPGNTYLVQGTTDLRASTWSKLGLTICELDGFGRFELLNGFHQSALFVRAIALIDANASVVVQLSPEANVPFELESADTFAEAWRANGAPTLGEGGDLIAAESITGAVPKNLFHVSQAVSDSLRRRAEDPSCRLPAAR